MIDFLGEVEDGWWKGRSQQTGKVRLLHCHRLPKHHKMSFIQGYSYLFTPISIC